MVEHQTVAAPTQSNKRSQMVSGFFKGLRNALVIYGLFAVVSAAVAGFGIYDFGLLAEVGKAKFAELGFLGKASGALSNLLPLAGVGTAVSGLFGALSPVLFDSKENNQTQAKTKNRNHEVMREAQIAQAQEQSMPFIMGTAVQSEKTASREHQQEASTKWRDRVGGSEKQQQRSHRQALMHARAQEHMEQNGRA